MQAFEDQGYQLYATKDGDNVEGYVRDGYAIAGEGRESGRAPAGTQHPAEFAAFAKDLNQGQGYTPRGTRIQQQYVPVSPYVRSALTPTNLFAASPRYYDAASPRYYEQPVYAVSRPSRCAVRVPCTASPLALGALPRSQPACAAPACVTVAARAAAPRVHRRAHHTGLADAGHADVLHGVDSVRHPPRCLRASGVPFVHACGARRDPCNARGARFHRCASPLKRGGSLHRHNG